MIGLRLMRMGGSSCFGCSCMRHRLGTSVRLSSPPFSLLFLASLVAAAKRNNGEGILVQFRVGP